MTLMGASEGSSNAATATMVPEQYETVPMPNRQRPTYRSSFRAFMIGLYAVAIVSGRAALLPLQALMNTPVLHVLHRGLLCRQLHRMANDAQKGTGLGQDSIRLRPSYFPRPGRHPAFPGCVMRTFHGEYMELLPLRG